MHGFAVPSLLLGIDFTAYGVAVGQTTVQAWADHRADFNFGPIQPAVVLGRVVDFQSLGNVPRPGANAS